MDAISKAGLDKVKGVPGQHGIATARKRHAYFSWALGLLVDSREWISGDPLRDPQPGAGGQGVG